MESFTADDAWSIVQESINERLIEVLKGIKEAASKQQVEYFFDGSPGDRIEEALLRELQIRKFKVDSDWMQSRKLWRYLVSW